MHTEFCIVIPRARVHVGRAEGQFRATTTSSDYHLLEGKKPATAFAKDGPAFTAVGHETPFEIYKRPILYICTKAGARFY